MKSAPQSKPINNAEHLRVPIVETHPDEIQPVNQAKNPIFPANQKPGFNSYTKNLKTTKNNIWKNKSGYTSNTAQFDPIEKKNREKVTSKVQEKAHTSIIPGPE